MKKLTLNQAWILCLRQWKWIIEQLDAGDENCINYLKAEWTQKNEHRNIENNCFFCQYSIEHGDCPSVAACKNCPGRLISARFDCEQRSSYLWSDKPYKFYAKLLKLNEKRKAKK